MGGNPGTCTTVPVVPDAIYDNRWFTKAIEICAEDAYLQRDLIIRPPGGKGFLLGLDTNIALSAEMLWSEQVKQSVGRAGDPVVDFDTVSANRLDRKEGVDSDHLGKRE